MFQTNVTTTNVTKMLTSSSPLCQSFSYRDRFDTCPVCRQEQRKKRRCKPVTGDNGARLVMCYKSVAEKGGVENGDYTFLSEMGDSMGGLWILTEDLPEEDDDYNQGNKTASKILKRATPDLASVNAFRAYKGKKLLTTLNSVPRIGHKDQGPRLSRLKAEDRNAPYVAVLGFLGLSERHKNKLRAKGLSDMAIESGQYASASWSKIIPESIDGVTIPFGLPGLSIRKDGTFKFERDGIILPTRNVSGKIIGHQFWPDNDEWGKYLYPTKSENKKTGEKASVIGLPFEDSDGEYEEKPLHISYPSIGTFVDGDVLELYACDGVVKADVIADGLKRVCFGFIGAHYSGFRSQLKTSLEAFAAFAKGQGATKVRLTVSPDAGDLANKNRISGRILALLKYLNGRIINGVSFMGEVLYWGQDKKVSGNDLDDLIVQAQTSGKPLLDAFPEIRNISAAEWYQMMPEDDKRWLTRELKLKAGMNFVDAPLKPTPSYERFLPENERPGAKTEAYLNAIQGWLEKERVVLDVSPVGSGKSYGVGEIADYLENLRNAIDGVPVANIQLYYLDNDPANATNERLKTFHYSRGRDAGRTFQKRDGEQKLVRITDPETQKVDLESNCTRFNEFQTASTKNLTSISSVICSSCMFAPKCSKEQGNGYGYLQTRKETFNAKNVITHPSSFVLPEEGEESEQFTHYVVAIDEATASIPEKSMEVTASDFGKMIETASKKLAKHSREMDLPMIQEIQRVMNILYSIKRRMDDLSPEKYGYSAVRTMEGLRGWLSAEERQPLSLAVAEFFTIDLLEETEGDQSLVGAKIQSDFSDEATVDQPEDETLYTENILDVLGESAPKADGVPGRSSKEDKAIGQLSEKDVTRISGVSRANRYKEIHKFGANFVPELFKTLSEENYASPERIITISHNKQGFKITLQRRNKEFINLLKDPRILRVILLDATANREIIEQKYELENEEISVVEKQMPVSNNLQTYSILMSHRSEYQDPHQEHAQKVFQLAIKHLNVRKTDAGVYCRKAHVRHWNQNGINPGIIHADNRGRNNFSAKRLLFLSGDQNTNMGAIANDYILTFRRWVSLEWNKGFRVFPIQLNREDISRCSTDPDTRRYPVWMMNATNDEVFDCYRVQFNLNEETQIKGRLRATRRPDEALAFVRHSKMYPGRHTRVLLPQELLHKGTTKAERDLFLGALPTYEMAEVAVGTFLLKRMRPGWTIKEISQRTGISESSVQRTSVWTAYMVYRDQMEGDQTPMPKRSGEQIPVIYRLEASIALGLSTCQREAAMLTSQELWEIIETQNPIKGILREWFDERFREFVFTSSEEIVRRNEFELIIYDAERVNYDVARDAGLPDPQGFEKYWSSIRKCEPAATAKISLIQQGEEKPTLVSKITEACLEQVPTSSINRLLAYRPDLKSAVAQLKRKASDLAKMVTLELPDETLPLPFPKSQGDD